MPHNPLTIEEALSPAARSSTRVRAPDEEEEGRGRPAQVTRRSAFDAFTDDVRQFTAGNPVFELLDFVAKQGGRFLGAEPGGASLVPWLGGSKSLGNVVSKRIGPASGRVRNVGADEGFFSKMFNLSEEAPENFARAREVAGSKPAREGSEAIQGALMQEQDLRRTMLEPLSTLDRSRLQGAINALERPKSTATLRAIMGNVEGMTPRRQIDDIMEAVGEADRAAIETLLEQARNF